MINYLSLNFITPHLMQTESIQSVSYNFNTATLFTWISKQDEGTQENLIQLSFYKNLT